MESQDREKEYERNVWELYRKEFATANRDNQTELNKRMLRWQELRDNGLTAVQAYMKAMQEESEKRVGQKPSDQHPATPPGPPMRKTSLVFLSLTLLAAIIYGFVITADRNAADARLQVVQDVLVSKQAEFNTELQKFQSVVASIQAELVSTKQTLTSIQDELAATKVKLEASDAKLKLYEETGIKVFSGVKPVTQKGATNLLNVSTATDPTWERLKSFLLADPTDDEYYSASFNCVDFAKMLHNNAEAAGIRSSFVIVNFEADLEGHALNAFNTTDKGLVHVDCTGGSISESRRLERDTIAYVVKGKILGHLSIEMVGSLEYSFYEQISKTVGSGWAPMGIVKSVAIYW